ncbi:histidine triad nucleotide-binding protein [Cohnella xylanilytica]|uniref:Histidine triad nucleotide-binding protein n=1 Tax=Cohnella xylanilytica TaxID=557555 RepID=A0A841U439_9BACL|nr:histidine triad nucleotide-binding protein [Cohnella xylanilytica]MBB6695487.1 histidine triad nucleotide-binding protein [Cohnella xylanilytica]GIO14796.1 histidine triad nucleotide-binding protein [Cohnella xylanilytica]
MDCLFCKIVEGTIPSTKVYEDEYVYAFKDIQPQAPVHLLVIPKKHIASLNEAEPGDAELLGRVTLAAQRVAKEAGLGDSGYRVLTNVGKDSGQVVFHIHFHVLGGEKLGALNAKG